MKFSVNISATEEIDIPEGAIYRVRLNAFDERFIQFKKDRVLVIDEYDVYFGTGSYTISSYETEHYVVPHRYYDKVTEAEFAEVLERAKTFIGGLEP